MSVWFLFLAFIPLAVFVYYGARSSWLALKMADDINLLAPPKQQVSYFGLDLIFVWRKHGKLFPERSDIRTLYKKYAIRAVAWFFITFITLLLLGELVTS